MDQWFTILDPSVTKSVNALRLIFSDNAVAESRARKKVEDSIGVGALSLLVAEALRPRVPLHLAVESLPGADVDGIVGDDVTLGHGESGDREGESVRRAGRQVGLGRVWLAFDFVLALVDGCCLDQSRGDGGDGGGGELHGERCMKTTLKLIRRLDRAVADGNARRNLGLLIPLSRLH